MRRIILVLLLLLPTFSAPVVANVTFGELEVRSFLNQALQAQFRVQGSVLATDEVEFRVAPEEAYRRAGLQRGIVPLDLRIELVGSGNDRVVRLTTQRPVREPYFGLLLEARWSSGRVLREYTILLDPPVAFQRERSAPPVVTRAPPPEPAPRPAARPEPARAAPVVSTTYAVRRGDTLSSIIRQHGYTGVTSQQAMLAILEANPQAFIGGNINQLRADVELRLPSEAEAATLGRQEALQEVRRQTAEWRARTTPSPPVPPPVAVPGTEPSPAVPAAPPAEVLAAPAVEVDPAQTAEVALAPDLAADPPVAAPVAGEDVALADAGAGVVDRLEILSELDPDAITLASADTQVIEEALLSQQVAMRELRDELSTLRTELAERDQLISLMNTELAQLEDRLQGLREERGENPQPGGATPDGNALYQRILADPLLLLLAATSLLLFLLLLVSVFRPLRGRVAAQETPAARAAPAARRETSPSAAIPERERTSIGGAASGVTLGAGAGAAAAAVASARHDERPPADLAGSADTIDVTEDRGEDLLADVDLYLAYGMNEQAITTLENAIRDGRDSPEYRVRLVEAYAAADDGPAVRESARIAREQLGSGDPALRDRITAAEDRFPASEEPVGPAGDDRTATGEPSIGTGVLEFDLSEEAERDLVADVPGSSEGEARGDDFGSLRFDLDDVTPPAPGEQEAVGRTGGGAEAAELPTLTIPGLEVEETDTASGAGAGYGADEDTSENGMKLSLAEAFVEMGDREGALALLEEILPTASASQRAKADELRHKIEGSGD